MRALPPLIDVTFVRGMAGDPAWAARVLDAGELARWTALHPTGRPLFLAAHVAARLLIRVGGGLAAAAVAPFIMARPAQAAGRCQYYYCDFMGM